MSSAAAPRPSPTRPVSVASGAKKRISAEPSTTAASGTPAPSVTRTDHRARNSAMNWRTTWSWPSRRHWSSTADAALIGLVGGEKLLGLERRHASHPGGGDRLAEDLVLDVAGGED